MEEQVAQKSTELEQYLQRVHELEDMYRQLEDALEDERHARQDEEAVRRLQARSVNEGGRLLQKSDIIVWDDHAQIYSASMGGTTAALEKGRKKSFYREFVSKV